MSVEAQCQIWVWDHKSQGGAPGCQQLEKLGCLHVVWVHMSVCAIANKCQAGLVASRIRGLGVTYQSGLDSELDAMKIRESESQLLERLQVQASYCRDTCACICGCVWCVSVCVLKATKTIGDPGPSYYKDLCLKPYTGSIHILYTYTYTYPQIYKYIYIGVYIYIYVHLYKCTYSESELQNSLGRKGPLEVISSNPLAQTG